MRSLEGILPVDEPFILNVADASARAHSRRATRIDLEPDDARWPDIGVNILSRVIGAAR